MGALRRLGAREPIILEFRSSFALVSFAGSTLPSWVSQVQNKRYEGPSVLQVAIKKGNYTVSLKTAFKARFLFLSRLFIDSAISSLRRLGQNMISLITHRIPFSQQVSPSISQLTKWVQGTSQVRRLPEPSNAADSKVLSGASPAQPMKCANRMVGRRSPARKQSFHHCVHNRKITRYSFLETQCRTVLVSQLCREVFYSGFTNEGWCEQGAKL